MSYPDLVVREACRWLRFSAEDLDVANRLLTGCPAVPRHVCWLAQQSAEKALKAALVLEEVEFPFSHDLDALRNLLPDGWLIRADIPDLAELTEWAVETRYPGEWPEATEEEATRAESQARAVHNSIVAEFERRGIGVRKDSPLNDDDMLTGSDEGDLGGYSSGSQGTVLPSISRSRRRALLARNPHFFRETREDQAHCCVPNCSGICDNTLRSYRAHRAIFWNECLGAD